MNATRVVKAVAATTAAVTLGFGLSAASVSGTHRPIPDCQYEDGSTQQICYWDGGDNGKGSELVNLDYGHWTYNISDGEWTDNFPEQSQY